MRPPSSYRCTSPLLTRPSFVATHSGTFLTGIFAQAHIANLDGYAAIPGGWLDRNFRQLGLQVAWICVGFGWTFVVRLSRLPSRPLISLASTNLEPLFLLKVTYAIMFVIDKIPGLHFRASEQAEIVGMDDTEHAEFAADYVGFRREADTVFTKSEKLWGSSGPPDNVSQRSVRSVHESERGRGVRVHDAIDEEKANGVDFAGGIPSEAPEKTGYRQPGGNENITRLRSRSRSRGLRSVGEHREVSSTI